MRMTLQTITMVNTTESLPNFRDSDRKAQLESRDYTLPTIDVHRRSGPTDL